MAMVREAEIRRRVRALLSDTVTQRMLAQRCGVSQAFFSQMLHGTRGVSTGMAALVGFVPLRGWFMPLEEFEAIKEGMQDETLGHR